MPLKPKIYIVLVNWNGWRDTIECLESVFRLNYSNFSVLVCDNASQDDSLHHIEEWAKGRVVADCSAPSLSHLVRPPVFKPIPFIKIEPHHPVDLASATENLFLIQTGANLGFAAGNNVGLRLALAAGDLDYTWLLNNDTVVDPDALLHLVERMDDAPEAGMCGSTLLYYDDPGVVQALGGATCNRWTARTGHLGAGQPRERIQDREWVERKLDYVMGASLFVRGQLLRDIGLLNERYFLYCEEIDWATRAKVYYTLTYAPGSIVYHKAGASTGKATSPVRSEYYATRARVLFTREFEPFALPSVIATIGVSVVHRLVLGRLGNAGAILRGAVEGWTNRSSRSQLILPTQISRAGSTQGQVSQNSIVEDNLPGGR
jgi:GT2 family glycosyltransferase